MARTNAKRTRAAAREAALGKVNEKAAVDAPMPHLLFDGSRTTTATLQFSARRRLANKSSHRTQHTSK